MAAVVVIVVVTLAAAAAAVVVVVVVVAVVATVAYLIQTFRVEGQQVVWFCCRLQVKSRSGNVWFSLAELFWLVMQSAILIEQFWCGIGGYVAVQFNRPVQELTGRLPIMVKNRENH